MRGNDLCLRFAACVALAACVDNGCPKGSEEVDGTCMELGAIGEGDGDGGTTAVDDPRTGRGSGGRNGSGGGSGTGGSGTGGSADHGDGGTGNPPDASCSSGCSENATCDAESGTCECAFGFAGDGLTCVDVDECAEGIDDCAADAVCTNEPGGFSCACPPGFEGDGADCTANPCEPRANPCDADTTTCRAENGSAVCDCREGLDRCDDDPYACTTDVRSDAAHCGACGAACAGDLACEAGECEQPVVQLALGAEHSCARRENGEVLCWGSNQRQQLGRADTSVPLHEPSPTGLGPVRLLAAGQLTNCAVTTADDAMVCWGHNLFQWVAPGEESGTFTVGDATSVQHIGLGAVHACMVVDGSAGCWGVVAGGVLGGDGSTLVRRPFDDPYVAIRDVLQMSVGVQACVITSDRRVRCWGTGSATPRVIEDARGPLEDVRGVSVAQSSLGACAVLSDGRILCWGTNEAGQVGNPAAASTQVDRPVVVSDQNGEAITGFEQVAVGRQHACGRRTDGSVLCWGARGQLGGGGSGATAQPYATPVRDIDDAIEVAAGEAHTCVRRRSGQVQCWGNNSAGQLGVPPSPAWSAVPVDVLGLP